MSQTAPPAADDGLEAPLAPGRAQAPRPALWAAVALGLGAMLVAAALVRWREGPPPGDLGALPDYSLIDAEGRPFGAAERDDAVRIVGFIFTRCGGQCPLIVERMRRLDGPLEGLRGVERLLVTVDPEFDRPEVLAAYAAENRLPRPAWRLVTGAPDAVHALIRGGFLLAVEKGSPDSPEPILHSTRLVLVDRRGHVRGHFDAFDDGDLERLARGAARLAGD